MSDRYAVLRYPGDVSELAKGLLVPREDGGTERRVPVLLGTDVLGHPYEVLDVEVLEEATDLAGERTVVRSAVHLGPASVDTMRGNRSTLAHQRRTRAAQLHSHARAAHFWRPDVYAPPAADQSLEAVEAQRAARGAA